MVHCGHEGHEHRVSKEPVPDCGTSDSRRICRGGPQGPCRAPGAGRPAEQDGSPHNERHNQRDAQVSCTRPKAVGCRDADHVGEKMGSQTMISYLDTNIAIFLHAGNVAQLTQRAKEQIESADLLVSGMVMLELEMLFEKGTIKESASQILSDLNQQIGLSVCQF